MKNVYQECLEIMPTNSLPFVEGSPLLFLLKKLLTFSGLDQICGAENMAKKRNLLEALRPGLRRRP